MRRWNGWGDDSIDYQLPTSAAGFLEEQVGKGMPSKEATFEDALRQVPKSRIPRHSMYSIDAQDRLLHARGQSFSDWLDLRSRGLDVYPDGVAYPATDEEVAEILHFASKKGMHIIPYGGGTSVVGHINPLKGKQKTLSVDMRRMNRLIDLDEESLQATFGAGTCGPDLEAQLRAHGFTLGHYPQSFEYSTLGGWIATRSSGQQSLRYGRIEKLFAGGKVQTPVGEMTIKSFPASAAGLDLRELVLGSEGRLGVLTQATVRISPIPEREDFHAVFFPDFEHGIQAVRQILASDLSLCMLRLSTAMETLTLLALAGHENLIGALERLLAIRGLGQEKCMLLLGFNGLSSLVHANRREALEISSKWGGVHTGKVFGQQWHKRRFQTPYLRNTLWDLGYGVDAFETATSWGNTPIMVEAIEAAIKGANEDSGERVHVFTHLSHVYRQGSSVYTTAIFRLAHDPEETLERWRRMKTAACQAIIDNGGTISHQHGVGIDHLPYLSAEKGAAGMQAISALIKEFDPKGMMNPGKLIV